MRGKPQQGALCGSELDSWAGLESMGVGFSHNHSFFLKKIHSIYKDTVELLLIPTPREGGAEVRARIAQDGGGSLMPPLTGRKQMRKMRGR